LLKADAEISTESTKLVREGLVASDLVCLISLISMET